MPLSGEQKAKLLEIAHQTGLTSADLDKAIIFARYTIDKHSFDAEPANQAIVKEVEKSLPPPNVGAPWSPLEKLVLRVITAMIGAKKEACHIVHFAHRRTYNSAQAIMKGCMI